MNTTTTTPTPTPESNPSLPPSRRLAELMLEWATLLHALRDQVEAGIEEYEDKLSPDATIDVIGGLEDFAGQISQEARNLEALVLENLS